jgi:hypothetical protein
MGVLLRSGTKFIVSAFQVEFPMFRFASMRKSAGPTASTLLISSSLHV